MLAAGFVHLIQSMLWHVSTTLSGCSKRRDRKRTSIRILRLLNSQEPCGVCATLWPTEASASEARAQKLLKLREDDAWFERSWGEILECQPPIHELAGGEHGILFLRWFLHQVLPYPSFLWDVHRVAARLRMKVEDLEALIDSDGGLAQDLRERMYKGILKDFLGKRWWRTAIEDYAWELGRGASENPNLFGDRLRERAGVDLELIDISDSSSLPGSRLRACRACLAARRCQTAARLLAVVRRCGVDENRHARR